MYGAINTLEMTVVKNLGSEELQKLEQLKRVKWLATLVLLLCFLAMVGAMLLESRYPAFAFVAAFAEAATIGGIADWYAVVALFKHPMGLPIPHTAIVPSNQHRIGDNIGRFIENNFLAAAPVREKLREVDFAGEIANWLSDTRKSSSLAVFATRLVPQVLETVDEKGLVQFATTRVTTQLEKTNIAPLVGDVMDSLTKDRRHQQLMNEIISALHRFLTDEEAIKAIRQKINEELPALLSLFRADQMILRRILKAAASLLHEIKDDPEHELRAEFEQFLKIYVKRLKRSKRFANRVEKLKSQILARPELANIAEQMWMTIRKFIEDDAQSDKSALEERLSEMFVDIGKNLKEENALRREINNGMVTMLAGFVKNQKSNISQFISDQVKGWDFKQLTLLIEANIGKDLQYIRFNGMLIGGLVGLLLHLVQIGLPHLI
ncbi:MAG: DUF445 family protein [Pseudomonadota bacterium]